MEIIAYVPLYSSEFRERSNRHCWSEFHLLQGSRSGPERDNHRTDAYQQAQYQTGGYYPVEESRHPGVRETQRFGNMRRQGHRSYDREHEEQADNQVERAAEANGNFRRVAFPEIRHAG